MATITIEPVRQTVSRTMSSGMLARVKRKHLWFIAQLYASFLLVQLYATFSGFNVWFPADFNMMIAGRAFRPYVTRVLVPLIINFVDAATPQTIKDVVHSVLMSPGLHPEFNIRGYSFTKAVFIFLAFAIFLATGYVFKSLAKHYFQLSEDRAHAVGIICLMMIPSMFRYLNYIYDPATILLSALMLLTLAQGQMLRFFCVFLLACVNKETAVLAIPIFAAFCWNARRRRTVIAAWCVSMATAWFLIRHRIDSIFASNPGGTLDVHFWDHQVVILRVAPMALLYAVLVMGGLVALAGHRWKEKPWELRAGLVLTIVPLFLLSIIFGFVDEIRALFDASPYLFLLAVPSLTELLGFRLLQAPGLQDMR